MTYQNGVAEGKKLIKFIERLFIAWETPDEFEVLKFGVTTEQMKLYWSKFSGFEP